MDYIQGKNAEEERDSNAYWLSAHSHLIDFAVTLIENPLLL